MNEEESKTYWAIEDYIANNHELCTIKEIMSETDFNRKKCKKILQELISTGQIGLAYRSKGRGSANVYIPKYMKAELLRTQRKPNWLDSYAFEDKKTLMAKVKDLRTQIDKFEKLEMLLYATGIPLEKAVYYSTTLLEFQDPVHDIKDKNNADISFFHEEKMYLIEVKGKKSQGNKDDVLQLEGWVTKKIEEEQMKSDDIVGILVVNHIRQEDPKDRDEPLTVMAKEFMKRYNFRLVSTPFLYDLMRKVVRKSMTKEEARNVFLGGENYWRK